MKIDWRLIMKLEEKVKMENLNISGKKKFPDSPNPKN